MTLFFLLNTIGVVLKNTLALPSFIMGVNRAFEAQKSTSIHHKSSPCVGSEVTQRSEVALLQKALFYFWGTSMVTIIPGKTGCHYKTLEKKLRISYKYFLVPS